MISVAQAQEILGLKARTSVLRLADEGKLGPVLRLGGQSDGIRLLFRDQVEKYEEERQRQEQKKRKE
jgi:hypothetical protein